MKAISICCILLSYFTHVNGQHSSIDTCNILEKMFMQPNTCKVLNLGNRDNLKTNIRVTDLTGIFKNCGGFCGQIPYFVVGVISPNLNTGCYRDIVITNFKKKNNDFVLDIYCASYLTFDNKNTNYHVELIYSIINGNEIKDIRETIAEWHDSQPINDYDNIKN